MQKLEKLKEDERISVREKEVLVETTERMLHALSHKHKDIQKEAHNMLSGQLPDIPYVQTLNKGFDMGRAEGLIMASRAMGNDDAAVCKSVAAILHITEKDARTRLAAFDANNFTGQ